MKAWIHKAGWGLLGLSGALQAGQLGLQPGQTLWDDAAAADFARGVPSLSEQVWIRLQQGDANQAVALLRAQGNPVLRHGAANEVLQRLRQQGPRPELAALLDWAEQETIQVLRRHDETAADWLLPMFDLAESARSLRQQWQHTEATAQWVQRFRSDAGSALRLLAAAPAEQQRVAADALQQLDATSLAAVATRTLAQPDRLDGAWWSAMARAYPNRSSYAAVLRYGNSQQRAQAVAELPLRLSADDVIALLLPLEHDAELASAATLALVQGWMQEPSLSAAGKREVLSRLADPARSPSAASALARLPDDIRLQRIDALWRANDNLAVRGQLKFALQLDASDAAQRLQREWQNREVQP